MSLLVTNIGELVTNSPEYGDHTPLGVITDAALMIVHGVVVWAGTAATAPAALARLDAGGAAVIPGFVDSHAHLVFDGDRSAEFAARMAGTSYRAGGIATTVAATRAASDDMLFTRTAALVEEMLRQGTTTTEIKSGYGLTTHDESRALRIAARFSKETTFLGAHVVPVEFQAHPDDYVGLVCGPMLEECAPHARWIDVFCEIGAFGVDAARAVLKAGMAAGLLPRVHANQLHQGPGVGLAVELGAASADHCTYLSGADIEALGASDVTVATLLPGAEFSTRSPYPDARALLDAGATVALATDCNPGTSFTTSMPLCIALAVREMAMTPAEALWAATAGGAAALRRSDIGGLSPGYSADLVILRAPSYVHLAYRPGVPLVERVLRAGVEVVGADAKADALADAGGNQAPV